MERNIVILGKVGSGKRTLANHICGRDIFLNQQGARNVLGTRSATVSDVGTYMCGEMLYRILTVDIESPLTGYSDPFPLIRKSELKAVHSIIFVIAHGRYTDESHAMLLYAVSSLSQQAKTISALVITHCEGMQDTQRKDISDEFTSNPRGSQIVAFMKKGIYTVGFVDTSTCLAHIKPIIQEGILKDEKIIRNMIDTCNCPITVENLSVQATSNTFSKANSPTVGSTHRIKRPGANVLAKSQTLPSFRPPLQHSSQESHAVPLTSWEEPETAILIQVGIDEMEVNTTTSSSDLRYDDDSAFTRLKEKSVIILGKVGSGKRTLGNHIAHGCTSREEILFPDITTKMDSVTREGRTFFQQFTKEDTLYSILTIDSESVTQSYTNPIEKIKKHFKNVNLIIFVIPYGIHTDESHKSLMHTVKCINYKASAISALVMTRFEGYPPKERNDHIAQFRVDDRGVRIAAFMGKGIYTVGFPQLHPQLAVKSELYEQQIREDEMTITNLVEGCETTLCIEDLLPPEIKPMMQHNYASQLQQFEKCAMQ